MKTTTRPFSLDLNLDDVSECADFIAKYGTTRGRKLANLLGISGNGSARLASSLSNYAWNKHAAINCRLKGQIQTAIEYEEICDWIYRDDIQPVCECW